jgi:hypothetical protein
MFRICFILLFLILFPIPGNAQTTPEIQITPEVSSYSAPIKSLKDDPIAKQSRIFLKSLGRHKASSKLPWRKNCSIHLILV